MVKLSDIAQRANVSIAAVSMALRNHTSISAACRARIHKIANELGYRPNPLVSAYQTNVRRQGSGDYHGTLAWIDDAPETIDRLRADSTYREMHEGALAQAAALGFQLEVLRLPELNTEEDQANQQRFARILKARGIPGAVFPPLWVSRLLTYDWADVAVATHGSNAGFVEKHAKPGWEKLVYTQVRTDTYHDTRAALHHLHALGYRRPALVTCSHHENSTGFSFSGASYAASREHTANEFIPPFVDDDDQLREDAPRGFRTWLREHKPDAIVTTLGHTRGLLSACGKEAPKNIGLAHPFLGFTEPGWSGIRENHALVGRMLVDAVVAQIYRNERGIPTHPKVMLATGQWEDGTTTRPQTVSPRAAKLE